MELYHFISKKNVDYKIEGYLVKETKDRLIYYTEENPLENESINKSDYLVLSDFELKTIIKEIAKLNCSDKMKYDTVVTTLCSEIFYRDVLDIQGVHPYHEDGYVKPRKATNQFKSEPKKQKALFSRNRFWDMVDNFFSQIIKKIKK